MRITQLSNTADRFQLWVCWRFLYTI